MTTDGLTPPARRVVKVRLVPGKGPVKPVVPKPKRKPKPKPPGRPKGRTDTVPNFARRTARNFREAFRINPSLDKERAFAGNGLSLLQAIYKDPDMPTAMRKDAAKDAMPFESPRLQSLLVRGNIGIVPHEVALDALRGRKASPVQTTEIAIVGNVIAQSPP